jgi:hypothetical protein
MGQNETAVEDFQGHEPSNVICQSLLEGEDLQKTTTEGESRKSQTVIALLDTVKPGREDGQTGWNREQSGRLLGTPATFLTRHDF